MEEIGTFEIAKPVVGSVLDLFQTMLSLEIEPCEPQDLPGSDSPQIAGSVSLAGEIIGAVTIETTDDFARLMTSAMLGMEVEEVEGEEEIKDVILETCNIISGGLKSALNDSGLSCVISSPTITSGRHFDIETLNMARYERFSFCSEGHAFHVEVCLKLAEDAPAEALRKLTAIDVSKFERLDIISSAGDAVIELFDLMLGMKLEMSETKQPTRGEGSWIVGAINFAGEVMGSVNIRLGNAFSRIVASKMMDVSLEEVNDDEQAKDAIGELCNIVAGSLKSAFCDSGLKCEMSPPCITVGDDFMVEILNMARYEQFAFKFYEHDIFVQVCVKIDENAQPANEDLDRIEAGDIDKIVAEAKRQAMDGKGSFEGETAPESAGGRGSDALEGRPACGEPAKGPAPRQDAFQEEEAGGQEISPNLDFVLNIPVDITVELGRTRMKMGQVSQLKPGAPIVLSNVENEDVSIFANKKLIAKGSVMVDHEKYGVCITEIVTRMERIRGLSE